VSWKNAPVSILISTKGRILARFSHENERLRNKVFQPVADPVIGEDVVFYFEG
jgi:hypothetical protein